MQVSCLYVTTIAIFLTSFTIRPLQHLHVVHYTITLRHQLGFRVSSPCHIILHRIICRSSPSANSIPKSCHGICRSPPSANSIPTSCYDVLGYTPSANVNPHADYLSIIYLVFITLQKQPTSLYNPPLLSLQPWNFGRQLEIPSILLCALNPTPGPQQCWKYI